MVSCSNGQNYAARSNENSTTFGGLGDAGAISPAKVRPSLTGNVGVSGSMEKVEGAARLERMGSGEPGDPLEYSNPELRRANSHQYLVSSPNKVESTGKNLGDRPTDFGQASVSAEIAGRDQSLAQNFNSFEKNQPSQGVNVDGDLQQQVSKNVLQED
jgi:hypothetical protein